MTPSDAVYEGFSFTIRGNELFIGLFEYNPVKWPDIVYPALLHKQNGEWVEIDERLPIWSDQQEDFKPEIMMSHILADFNKTIESIGGEAMTWNQKLAALFLLLVVEDNQLVLK